MKALLLNGSPHKNGTTNEALMLLSKLLLERGIQSDIFHIGSKVESCMGCFSCMSTRKCVIQDQVNELHKIIQNYDSLIIGAPVYFSSPAGGAISFLDRLFESGFEHLRYKPAASFSVARRAGTAASNDVLNKYFLFSNMPIVSTNYLNSLFGRLPEDIYHDEEGLYLLTELAENMSWMLKNLKVANENNVPAPPNIDKYYLRNLS